MKRTQLHRHTPLRSSTPLARVVPLRARSAKRRRIAPERRAFVRFLLARRPWCQRYGCLRASTDVHEVVRRSQGSPIVPSQGLTEADVLALCRPCHDWATGNPEAAHREGLVRWGWERRHA